MPEVERRHQAEVVLNRLRMRAYGRALGRLRDKHRDEFDVLLAEEKDRVRREPIILVRHEHPQFEQRGA